jgi:signal transduction protein with GAF and PtsI domain
MTQPVDARDANYVLTLEEIGNLAEASGKPAETLMNVVALIAARAKTDVCSVYLLEPDRANMVLAATVGLRPECIGTLSLALNEGLAGLDTEQVQQVAVGQAQPPALQIYSARRAKIPTSPSWASPSLTAACCKASWW